MFNTLRYGFGFIKEAKHIMRDKNSFCVNLHAVSGVVIGNMFEMRFYLMIKNINEISQHHGSYIPPTNDNPFRTFNDRL